MKHAVGNLIEGVQRGIIIHQVNAQGVMGSGIAAQLRAWYPIVWEDYSAAFGPNPSEAESRARLGDFVGSEVRDELYVISLVGQQFYGRQEPQSATRYTSYDALDDGLKKISMSIRDLGYPDIHHPMIGAGLGGGCWNVIKEIIEHRLGSKTTLWTLP